MKVMLKLAVEVDPAAWDLAYGTGTRAKDVVDDVRRYAVGQLQGSAAAEEGAITEVELR